MVSTIDDRTRHRPGTPRGWRRAVVALVAALIAPVALPASPVAAATPTTYQDHTYGSGAIDPSSDKPQSKLWYNDNAWWAVMAGSSSVNIYKLGSNHVWTDTGVVADTRLNSTADALWAPNGTLYLVSRNAGSSGRVQVNKFKYNNTSKKYVKATGFPKTLPGTGTESATLDRDSLGRIWVTFTRDSAVYVTHSTTSSAGSFVTPFRISGADTTVSPDDISALIAFSGKIGVMWSDQGDGAVRFAVHNDADNDSTWSLESPLAGTRLSDDHINIKSLLGDDLGRVHAAVKTSLGDSPSDPGSSPSIVVLTRDASGNWTNATAATVSDNLTRPQVVLDKTNKQIYVMQSDEGGGSVYYKQAPLSNISFSSGKGAPLIQWPSASINNVSTGKDPVTVTTGIVAIAADSTARRYYHAEMPLDGSPPPPPGDTTPPTVSSVTPADGSTGVATSTTVTATFSEPVDPTTVSTSSFTLSGPSGAVAGAVSYDGSNNRATFTPSSALAAGASYTATVTTAVEDVAGNAMTSNKVWSFGTASSGGGSTVTLSPVADSYVRSTSASSNFGTESVLRVDNTPIDIAYLKYDLSAYAGQTITSAKLRLQVTTSGSTGKQTVKSVSNDSWTETGLTYSNKPPVGTTIGTLLSSVPNTSYDVTLTTSAVGNELGQQISLGIKTASGNDVVFASRETATPPQLVLEIG